MQSKKRLLIAASFAVCAVLLAVHTVYRSFYPYRRPVAVREIKETPIGDVPAQHKFDSERLRAAILDTELDIPHLNELADFSVQAADTYGHGTVEKFERYWKSQGIAPPKYWNDPQFASLKHDSLRTTESLVCGWKDVTVRPRYIDGVKQRVEIGREASNLLNTDRYPGMPDIATGKLDIYEVIVPAFGLEPLSGEYSVIVDGGQPVQKTLGGDAFDSVIGFWMTYWKGKWRQIGVSVYAHPDGTVIANPVL